MLPLALILVLSGCYKDDVEFIVNDDKSQIDLFFDAVQTLEKTTFINSDVNVTLFDADNSLISIPANCFEVNWI